MGLTYASIEIENLFTKREMKVEALVDSGSVFLTIPEHVAVQLGFDINEVGTREVVLANAHRQEVPMVGPLTNAERAHQEIDDLMAAVEMLNEEFDFGYTPNRGRIEAKKVKVNKFADYSAQLGLVNQ